MATLELLEKDQQNFYQIAKAYGLKSCKINSKEDLALIPDILSEDGPVLCEINMNRNQLMIPRVQSEKDKNGNIVSNSLDKMYPYTEMMINTKEL